MFRIIINTHLFYLAAAILASWLVRWFHVEPWSAIEKELLLKLERPPENFELKKIAVFVVIIIFFYAQRFHNRQKRKNQLRLNN
jgi:hypothetical protein